MITIMEFIGSVKLSIDKGARGDKWISWEEEVKLLLWLLRIATEGAGGRRGDRKEGGNFQRDS